MPPLPNDLPDAAASPADKASTTTTTAAADTTIAGSAAANAVPATAAPTMMTKKTQKSNNDTPNVQGMLNSDVGPIDPLRQRRMREENEFIWANFGEPHAERRRRIFAKYGKEIKKLMVIEWKTKWIAFAVVVTQMTCSYTLPQYFLSDFLGSHGWLYGGKTPCVLDWALDSIYGGNYTHGFVPEANAAAMAVDPQTFAPWYTTWAPLLFIGWLFGGALTQNMFLGIHEISHNTAFKTPLLNDLLCIWCNFVVPVPFAMAFKTYHQEHHRYLGWEGVDTDLPEHIEAVLLHSLPGKIFFLFFQTLFYAVRPMISRQFVPKKIHYMNWAVMILWWLFQYSMFGGLRFAVSYVYCIWSSLSTGLFHPTSGHFISEHYVFNPDTFQETFSYYGLGNIIGWNVGYHNEHHDFPSVPWSLLPKITEIAPEFYEPLEKTTSWTYTLYEFLTNSSISEFSRVKRERGAGRRVGKLLPTTPEDSHTPAADPLAMRARLDFLQKEYPYDSNNKTIVVGEESNKTK